MAERAAASTAVGRALAATYLGRVRDARQLLNPASPVFSAAARFAVVGALRASQ